LGGGYWLWREGDPAWRTALFTTLVFCQLAMALAVRSEKESLLRTGLLTNKPMLGALAITIALQMVLIYWPPAQRIFSTTALPPRDLILAFGLSLAVLVLVEIWKVFVRARSKSDE
jgi:Ca2+-transporting ATPase